MKVKISHSMEVDEITKKISNLTKDTVVPLQKLADLLNSVSIILEHDGDEAVQYSYQSIDRIRKNLAEIDEILADTQGLMGGYIKSILDPQPHDIQPPTPPSMPSETQEESKMYWDNTTRSLKNKPVTDQGQQ